MKDRSAQIESIVRGALELPVEQDRDQYIEEACAGDVELKAEVCALLQANVDGNSEPDIGGAKIPPRHKKTELAGLGVAAVLSESAGSMIGRYKLLQEIGEGGMGIVYMAEQTEPVVRKVALKIIKLGMDTREVVARFEAERQALALMDHPNIARVFDGGATDTGRPFFVMELVQGVPINEFCDKNCLSTEERIRLFIPACQAIQSAHQKGIIHRDIKPSNIMVTMLHGEPMAKVIDFGVAKATHHKLTEKTLFTKYATMIGTPAYMSPEQAEMSAVDVDTRTDVYSLGVVLYELLIGSTPVPEERLRSAGFGEIQRIISEEEPERPSTRLSTLKGEQKTELAKLRGVEGATLQILLKGDLDWIAMKCLEKDRRRRYGTPSELAADLERFLEHEPVTAAAPTLTYTIRKLYAKHRGFVQAMAAAILIVATVVSGYLAIRMNHLRKDAEIAKNSEAEQRARAVELAEDASAAQLETSRLLVQSRREQGKGWLERAGLLLERKDYFSARMMAGRAIGFQGFGREDLDPSVLSQFPTLIEVGTQEYNQAAQILRSKPAYSLIWESPSTARAFEGIHCLDLSPDGSLLAAGSEDNLIRLWNVVPGQLESVISGHTDAVFCVAFNPDGTLLASGGRDRTIGIWEVETGQLKSLLRGHGGTVVSIEFSPDGSLLASSSHDRTARLWNVRSGQLEAEFVGHSARVRDVAFSPNGSLLASGSFDGSVRLWDVASTRLISELSGHPGYVASLAFNTDGSVLAAGSVGSILLWEAETGQLKASLTHPGRIRTVEFSPDGSLLASGGDDTTVRLWNIDSGLRQLESVIQGHSNWVTDVAFSPDGSHLMSAGHDNSILRWDLASKQAKTSLTGHSGRFNSVVSNIDGSLLAAGGVDGISLWDVSTGRLHAKLSGHSKDVTSVVFRGDGSLLASGSHDRTVRIWDLASGKSIAEFAGHAAGVTSIAVSSDGATLASGSHDGSVRLWDLPAGQLRAELRGHSNSVHAVAINSDGTLLASGSNDDSLCLWDIEGAQLKRRLLGHTGKVTSVDFSPDGSLLASGSSDHSIRFWNGLTGQLLKEIAAPWGRVRCLAFSPNGALLASGNDDQAIRLWDVESGQLIALMNRESGPVLSVSFSPDGSFLSSGHSENSIALWDLDPGPLTIKHPSPSNDIIAASAAPDGSRLASSHSNATLSESWISIWDSSSGHLRAELEAQSDQIISIVFSDDGSLLAAGDAAWVVRLWEVESARLKRELIGHEDVVRNVAFSPDHSLLAAGGTSRKILLWDLGSGEIKTRLPALLSKVQSVKFSPNSSHLALGGTYGSLVLWDVESAEVETELTGHGDSIQSLAFAPDGSILASGSTDHSIRLWELGSGRLISEFVGHNSPVRSLRFSPDGARLASGRADNTIRIWDVVTGEVLLESFEGTARSTTPPTLSFLPDGSLSAFLTVGSVIRRRAPEAINAPRWAPYLRYAQIGGRHVNWTVDAVSKNLYQSTPGIPLMPVSDNHLLSVLSKPRDSVDRWNALFWKFYRSANWLSAEMAWNELVDLGAGRKEGFALAEMLMICATRAMGDGQIETAQRFARYALRINPELAEAYRLFADAFLEVGRPAQALRTIDEAIGRVAALPELYQLRAKALEALNRPEEAVEAITKALGQLDDSDFADVLKRREWALYRSKLYLAVGEREKSIRDRLDGLNIPHRDLSSEYPPELIDLSSHYHSPLTVNWKGKKFFSDNTLKSLIENQDPSRPMTLPDVEDIPFDIRGVIQLSSSKQRKQFPREVKGIEIGKKFKRIHFLQATVSKELENIEVGRYVLSYADGTEKTIPAIFGSNTFDYWKDVAPTSEKLPELRVAWQGENPHAKIALYLASWDNPKSNVEVESFDFISAQARAAPFLVAVTVE